MKWNVGTKIGVGFGIVLTIFVIVGAVSYRSVVRQTETASAVTHSYAVENVLTELLASLQDAETGQRGYLITGLDSYLEPYNNALPEIEQHRTDLAGLVADNPDQLAHLDALGPLITQKLTELQQTIDLRRTKDFASAQTVVLTGAGKNSMDSIRGVLQEMRAAEEHTLRVRTAARELDAHEHHMDDPAGHAPGGHHRRGRGHDHHARYRRSAQEPDWGRGAHHGRRLERGRECEPARR